MTTEDLENWCFVKDDDGHWYKIPVRNREDFYEWLEQSTNYIDEEDLESCYDEFYFDNYRCTHPINYMFKDIEVLKESK